MLHAHRAPLADAERLLDELRELRDVERAHRLHVRGETPTACPIGLAHGVVDEGLPRRGGLEVATSTKEQLLLVGERVRSQKSEFAG